MELGAGCGTVGMALARLGASVTVSDTPEMLPVLASNVAKNFGTSNDEGGGGIGSESSSFSDGPIDCVEQLWGEPLKGGPYDLGELWLCFGDSLLLQGLIEQKRFGDS